jgi:hypothetical protein
MNISKYHISPNGVVTNTKTNKVLKQQNHSNGYKKITLTDGVNQKSFFVHRLVAEKYIKNPNNLPQVNHKDGNKQNNDVSNLEWCNNSQNQIHACKIGLKPTGNNLWNGKFTKEQIFDIRLLRLGGMKISELSARYNTTKSTISQIVNNKRYIY